MLIVLDLKLYKVGLSHDLYTKNHQSHLSQTNFLQLNLDLQLHQIRQGCSFLHPPPAPVLVSKPDEEESPVTTVNTEATMTSTISTAKILVFIRVSSFSVIRRICLRYIYTILLNDKPVSKKTNEI